MTNHQNSCTFEKKKIIHFLKPVKMTKQKIAK